MKVFEGGSKVKGDEKKEACMDACGLFAFAIRLIKGGFSTSHLSVSSPPYILHCPCVSISSSYYFFFFCKKALQPNWVTIMLRFSK